MGTWDSGFRLPPATLHIKWNVVDIISDVTMDAGDEEDNSWEEVYRANGVRCDIEIVSSPNEPGVCPTPLVNPFFFSFGPKQRWSLNNIVTLDVFA